MACSCSTHTSTRTHTRAATAGQVRCDKAGQVVNITLTSPDNLRAQYGALQALTLGADSHRASIKNDINADDPSEWEAVTKFHKHWPEWHYQTPQLGLRQLPDSDNWVQLGRDSLQELHLDNTLCARAPILDLDDGSRVDLLSNGCSIMGQEHPERACAALQWLRPSAHPGQPAGQRVPACQSYTVIQGQPAGAWGLVCRLWPGWREDVRQAKHCWANLPWCSEAMPAGGGRWWQMAFRWQRTCDSLWSKVLPAVHARVMVPGIKLCSVHVCAALVLYLGALPCMQEGVQRSSWALAWRQAGPCFKASRAAQRHACSCVRFATAWADFEHRLTHVTSCGQQPTTRLTGLRQLCTGLQAGEVTGQHRLSRLCQVVSHGQLSHAACSAACRGVPRDR